MNPPFPSSSFSDPCGIVDTWLFTVFLLAYFIVLQYKRRRDLLSLYVFYLGIKKEGKWCFRLIFISVMASSDTCDVKHSRSSAVQYDPLKVDLQPFLLRFRSKLAHFFQAELSQLLHLTKNDPSSNKYSGIKCCKLKQCGRHHHKFAFFQTDLRTFFSFA